MKDLILTLFMLFLSNFYVPAWQPCLVSGGGRLTRPGNGDKKGIAIEWITIE